MVHAQLTHTMIAERETIRANEAKKQQEREAEMRQEEMEKRVQRENFLLERARQWQDLQRQAPSRRN